MTLSYISVKSFNIKVFVKGCTLGTVIHLLEKIYYKDVY